MQKAILYLIFVFLLAGCTSYTHKQPDPVVINNEKFINMSMDKTWQMAFNQLFDDVFTVDSLDKNTGTIVASFTTDRPTNYIDCGIVKTNYRDDEKVNHQYIYNYAQATKYSYDKNSQRYDADVKTTLDTVVTANIAKAGEGSTVTINVDYTLKREITSTNHADKTQLPVEEEILAFTSTKPYQTEEFSCISTGAIEDSLLGNIK